MSRVLLRMLFVLICAISARSQHGAYRFDNFDMRSGVAVKPSPTPPKPKLSARAVRKGAAAEKDKAQLLTLPRDLHMSANQSLDGFTTGNQKIDQLIVASAKRNQLDPVLLYAIMHRESSFKTHAVSPKGARGLMQLMPGTAVRFGVRDIFDPAQNIEGGARYMRFLLDTFNGDVKLALAGYNAGEYAVIKYEYSIPPYRETQDYVRLIGARYALMRDPLAARKARTITNKQAAKLAVAESAPKIYEPTVSTIRLPDGKSRLISQ